jgi:DNA-binding NtrC family response regulator
MPKSNMLFVDDDFWGHLENCEFLRERGFHIVEAYTASEACAAIDGPARLSALVTDIELGDRVDGFELARRARAAYPHVPVVYMSGTATARHNAEGVSHSEFISKPFHPQQIMDALDRATDAAAA